MSPEKQRIVIAEVCGWEFAGLIALIGPGDPRSWRGPNSERMVGVLDLPDYLNDLNAMHEAILSLPKHNEIPLDRNIDRYNDYLIDVCGSINEALNATAAQRAEAFLRMMGLWVGSDSG